MGKNIKFCEVRCVGFTTVVVLQALVAYTLIICNLKEFPFWWDRIGSDTVVYQWIGHGQYDDRA